MRGFSALALALGLTLAQAPKPLLVGGLKGEAVYPGGRGVAYGEARLLARGLGLAIWQGEGRLALGLGSRYRVFPILEGEAQAAAQGAAWRKPDGVYVPLRALAQALGLTYQAQEGIRLGLPWAELRGQEGEVGRRLVLRFSREVNALNEAGGVLFLLAQGPGLEAHPLGGLLPLTTPPDRILYPGGGQVVLEWGGGRGPVQPLVLLDPGHGGEDPGLVLEGLREKDLTLDLAQRVARLLPYARLTRKGDETLSLTERLRQAQGAGVVVSFHLRPGSALRLLLPQDRPTPLGRNAERLLPGLSPERARLLKAYAGDPRALAQALERGLMAIGIPVERVEGPFALTRVDGAAVILEIGLERLRTPEARAALAQAVARGVQEYLR